MHQDPEHENYDDDDYNQYPSYNEYGYQYNSKKFDVDWAAWEQWLSKAIQEIVEEDKNVWVFGHNLKDDKKFTINNASIKDTSKDKYFMYLGSNYYNEGVWKSKYFIVDNIEVEYKQHLASNAAHFLRQPHYYKGLYDNLN